jgi:hypothetical protein
MSIQASLSPNSDRPSRIPAANEVRPSCKERHEPKERAAMARSHARSLPGPVRKPKGLKLEMPCRQGGHSTRETTWPGHMSLKAIASGPPICRNSSWGAVQPEVPFNWEVTDSVYRGTAGPEQSVSQCATCTASGCAGAGARSDSIVPQTEDTATEREGGLVRSNPSRKDPVEVTAGEVARSGGTTRASSFTVMLRTGDTAPR